MKDNLMSPLASLIRRYLALKQALGRRFTAERHILTSLDHFLAEQTHDYRDLTCEAFFQWCELQRKVSPTVRRNQMRIVRNFCLYRRRSQPDCFVPDTAAFPLPHQPVRPYIFSEAEVARLLDLCPQLPLGHFSPHRRELYRLLIILLFTTGLRRGELLKLTIRDYDRTQGTLLIRCSKFHKSRLLPLPRDVCREVDRYLDVCRRHRLPTTPETPLAWNSFHGGHTYTAHSLRLGMSYLLRLAKIMTDKGRLPRIHDFRHAFAVNALLRWYRSGVDVQSKLPFLAAYMGHVSIVSTYYCLDNVI
jgi:integrase